MAPLTGVLRLGDVSVDVGALQQALIEAGIPPTGEGDRFGDATLAAVQTFQAKHNLAADGLVGPRTWAALNGESDPSTGEPAIPAPDYAGMDALMAAALAIADGEWRRGVREIGTTNRGVEVDQYLRGVRGDGADMLCYRTYAQLQPACSFCQGKGPTAKCIGSPWCSRFAIWCIQTAAVGIGSDPTKGFGDLAGASKCIRWATKTDRLVGAGTLVGEKPMPGDLMAISTPGHGHVMLSANIVGNKVATREGNASQRVNAHWRDIASITAWIRVTRP